MSFYSTISEGIKDAMRSKDKERLSALRDIKSKLILEATKTGAEAESIDDATAFSILNKLYKQRNESAEIYQEQNRPDLESEERAQAAPERPSGNRASESERGGVGRMPK